MAIVLDTSILIGAERGAIQFEPFLRSLGDEPVGIAAITASELIHGSLRAASPAVRARRSAWVEGLLDTIPILPFGLPEARRHAELWVELLRIGHLIGPHDMLIAATALARGARLATFNEEEFSRVPGLHLIDRPATS